MKIKRNEPFRYTFKEPITGEFYLVKDGRRTPAGLMHIHNISPSGIAITTPLKLPLQKTTTIIVEFSLLANTEPLKIEGQLLHEKWIGTERLYGLHLHTTKQDRESIVQAVKHIAKNER
ncbi:MULTISPECIES: PilZ domain-containing protein [unclassified Exiguobacterium]|uniref:PilZ domain-containing protein n=1 Tax=unclassified Exiguobacterium TaxID=2644629 RepID=UPI000B58FC2D|nr:MULTISPECIES: PilZ domain-containing protein [unclassified Exiguobacterium]ASI35602.1 pilus assembly protein PilZ [Exiguobacterium sp. N4-1P]